MTAWADSTTLKTFDVTLTLPHRAIERVQHQAVSMSTDGGVLTFRGTADAPFSHVVSYGPRAWLKVESHLCRWNTANGQHLPCACGAPYPAADAVAAPPPQG